MTKQQFNDSVNQEVKRLTQQGERKYCEETPPTKANDATNETRERFVILEGIEHHNRFFTMYSGGDPTKSDTGGTWYKILGYADTVSEAQIKLYGRDFPLPVSEHTSGLPRTPIQKQLMDRPTSFSQWLEQSGDSIDIGGNVLPDRVKANHDIYKNGNPFQ